MWTLTPPVANELSSVLWDSELRMAEACQSSILVAVEGYRSGGLQADPAAQRLGWSLDLGGDGDTLMCGRTSISQRLSFGGAA